eukprot:scaffold224_cov276-Chaetoceros_neogracile.AAC.13
MAKRSGNILSTTLIAADKGSSSGRHDRSCKLRSSSICTIVEEVGMLLLRPLESVVFAVGRLNRFTTYNSLFLVLRASLGPA